MVHRLLAFVSGLGALAGFAHADVKLQPYDLVGGVHLGFPKQPTHEVLNSGKLPLDRFTAQMGASVYRAVVMEIPGKEQSMLREEIDNDPNGKYVRTCLDRAVEGLIRTAGGTAKSTQYGGFRGYPARRTLVESTQLSSYSICLVTPKRYVMILIAFPKGAANVERTQKFFDSLEIGVD